MRNFLFLKFLHKYIFNFEYQKPFVDFTLIYIIMLFYKKISHIGDSNVDLSIVKLNTIGKQIGINVIGKTMRPFRERKPDDGGDSFEYASNSGATGFRLRRARRVIPKGVKLSRKHRT